MDYQHLVFIRFTGIVPLWDLKNVFALTIPAKQHDGIMDFSDGSMRGKEDRQKLEDAIHPNGPIHWLNQVHGNRVISLPEEADVFDADAVVTKEKRVVCAVRTADCLPVVFTTASGDRVGVAHAGWKGLSKGVLEETFKKLGSTPEETLIWIGPSIAAKSYEVGEDVRSAFSEEIVDHCFSEVGEGKYHFNMLGAAKMRLEGLGIPSKNISGGCYDTFTDERFHSARRDGDQSGRMATIVWFE